MFVLFYSIYSLESQLDQAPHQLMVQQTKIKAENAMKLICVNHIAGHKFVSYTNFTGGKAVRCSNWSISPANFAGPPCENSVWLPSVC